MVDPSRAGALPSQELREWIRNGKFGIELTERIEDCIQPASFDAPISDHCYRVPAQFKPEHGATILESLRRLSSLHRPRVNTDNGVLLIPNDRWSWLFFLEGTYAIPRDFWVRSSPKSTEGRLGNLVQLVADCQTRYDEIDGGFHGKLAVKVTPRAISNVVYPGERMNQLRIFTGHDFNYDERTLRQLAHTEQLLFVDDEPLDAEQVHTRRGLEVHIDLESSAMNGLIGWVSNRNPEPIDRRQKYEVHRYFDPIEAPRDGRLFIDPRNPLYILFTREDIRVPRSMAAELSAVSTEHGAIRIHEAGFADPSFGYGESGKLRGMPMVLEVHALGHRGEELTHGQAIGTLVYHPVTQIPDKWYGMDDLGSNYAGQKGPRPAKYFMLPTDMDRLLRKQREKLMALSTDTLFTEPTDQFQGFMPADGIPFSERILANPEFHPRFEVEDDPLRKQPIPYIVIVNPTTKHVFMYERGRSEDVYGEKRLYGHISIGVGGHVRPSDAENEDPLVTARNRELFEEVSIAGQHREPVLLGYINDEGRTCEQVHFGLLYVLDVNTNDVTPKSSELRSGQMTPLDHCIELNREGKLEPWSKIAVDIIAQYLGR